MGSELDRVKEFIKQLDGADIDYENSDFIVVKDLNIDKKIKITTSQLTNLNSLENENGKLKIFNDRGFKFGDYLEVFIDYYSVLDYVKNYDLNYFSIGDVKVCISEPSDLFRVIFYDLESDKYYDAKEMWTISLTGINNDNYEDYLSQAIFMLGYYNASTESDDYPHTYEFFGEEFYRYAIDEDELDARRKRNQEFETMQFSTLNYPEVISFYNAGMEIKDKEISFAYFYKVLEHFFLIARQKDFISFIDEYNRVQDINKFIDTVTKVYRQNEDIQLLELLNSIQSEISLILNEAYNLKIISSISVEEFSNELYLYRNSIIHGKSDDKFDIKTPSIVFNNEERFWNRCVEKIAEILILKYCLK